MRTAVFFQFQLDSSFMIRRTHGNMFRRTLFEYCVWKDTFQNVIHSVAKVYAVFPFYDAKCLCSGGQECRRGGSHSH